LADHQRLRLSDHEPYGLTVAAIRGHGLQPRLPRAPRRDGVHAVARDQGRQGARPGVRAYAFSSHTRHRFTITSTAFSMSCAETHSRREWKFCSPAKMFGVGSPMKLSFEPSVPPRMAFSTGSMPARRIASRAFSTTCGSWSSTSRMLR